MVTENTDSPLKRLIEAGNDLIAEGMAALKHDNPDGHAAALAFDKPGTLHRLFIDSLGDETTIDFVLYDKDGEMLRVLQFCAKRINPLRH